MKLLVGAALGALGCVSAIAGGPSGTWRCTDLSGNPVMTIAITIDTDAPGGHTYVSQAVSGDDWAAIADSDVNGSGDLNVTGSPDGYPAFVPTSGALHSLAIQGEHRGMDSHWVQGVARTPVMTCKR